MLEGTTSILKEFSLTIIRPRMQQLSRGPGHGIPLLLLARIVGQALQTYDTLFPLLLLNFGGVTQVAQRLPLKDLSVGFSQRNGPCPVRTSSATFTRFELTFS